MKCHNVSAPEGHLLAPLDWDSLPVSSGSNLSYSCAGEARRAGDPSDAAAASEVVAATCAEETGEMEPLTQGKEWPRCIPSE